MKRRVLGCVLVGMLVFSLLGCGAEEEEVAEIETKMLTDDTEESGDATEASTGEVTVVGQVISVSGNMVTIQVGTYSESAGMGEGTMGSAPGMTEGELPEGLEEGELPEGLEEGELPEGLEEGEMPEGMTEREIPEGVEEGEMSEGMSDREIPEGVEDGELPEGVEEGELPEGMTEGGMSQGGMAMVPGTVEGGIEAVDMSDVIELTDEVIEITIPVGTPVYSMGVEYDFTDIVEECYITITENTSGTIIEVNILG